ncbi:hypothetical protein ES705_35672 [subsurface metagenome]|jgi:hypothetical protein
MEFLIKCGGWIAALIGTVIAILILKKMEKDKKEGTNNDKK